jgi:hypothetical protein
MAKPPKKTSGRRRLGISGEYQPKGLLLDRHDIRRRFFEILTELQPETFDHLRAVYATVQDKPELWHYPVLPNGLREWGTRWNLSDLWCLDLAREFLGMLDAERKGEIQNANEKTTSLESFALGILAYPGIALGSRKINLDDDSVLPPEEPFIGIGPFSLSVLGWRVFNEAEEAFSKRADQQFKQELKGYIARAKAAAKSRGAIRTRVKGATLEEHLSWLARAAVKGERPAHIWKSLPRGCIRSRRAVETAIHKTANLIGLTLNKKINLRTIKNAP